VREGSSDDASRPRVQLMGSGAILREVLAAADMLEQDFGVVSDVWSVTSFTELRREGLDVERWNVLHPEEEARLSFVERSLVKRRGPVVAATDYMRSYADQIRPFVRARYSVLGTDGYGRSDVREKRAASKGSRRRGAGRASGAVDAAQDTALLSAADEALLDRLKAWRLAQAKAQSLPAYVILHDATLAEIARRRPLAAHELEGITGIGAKKLERYGDELVALVAGGELPAPEVDGEE